MSILIDRLIEEPLKKNYLVPFTANEIYISRPDVLHYPFRQRVKDAWEVLTGRAIAVNFKEDE